MGNTEQWISEAAGYRQRHPRESALWKLFSDHYDEFEKNYSEKFETKYGFFRKVIPEVVRNYIKCGDLKQGFARVRCPNCCHEYLLSFSCLYLSGSRTISTKENCYPLKVVNDS
jgi:hypothetical protein